LISGLNVGIGTTTPSTTLDVNGIIRTQPRSTATCNTNTAGGIYCQKQLFMRKSFIPFKIEGKRFKTFLKNKDKDFLAVFICLFIVIISLLLIGKADPGAKVQFTANTIISLSGTDTPLYALGQETVSGTFF